MDALDMSIAKELLSLLPKDKAQAMNAKELFEKCTYAGYADDVSKGLSGLFKANQIRCVGP